MASNDALLPQPSTQPEPAATERRRRRRPLIAALAAAALAIGGGVAVASAHKSIALDIDGEERTVTTFAGSVQGLLEDEDVVLGEHDAVGPGPEAALEDGMLVVVRSASEIEVEVNGEPTTIWTTARTTGEAIHSLGESGRQVTVAASRSLDGTREALHLPLVDGRPVDVAVDGETIEVIPAGEADLEGVLALAGVTLAKLDEVQIGTALDGTVVVQVSRVSHDLRTDAEEIPFETTERQDSSLYVGERRVVQEGVAGERVRAVLAVHADGEVAESEASKFVTLSEPVERVVAVGTKQRPAPVVAAPAPSSGSSGSSSGGSSSGGSAGSVPGGVWGALAQCESGGNPSIVSPNGLYHGLYQFSVSTWQSVGGSGLPSQASPAEQTQRAQALQARSGWGQWPACSARLGLR